MINIASPTIGFTYSNRKCRRGYRCKSKSLLPQLPFKAHPIYNFFFLFFTYLDLERPKLLLRSRCFLAKPPPKTLDPTSLLVLSVIVITDAYGDFTGPNNSATLPTLLPDPSIRNSPALTLSAPVAFSFTINLPLFARCMISPTSSV